MMVYISQRSDIGPQRRYHVIKPKNGFLGVNFDIVTSNLCLEVNNKIASSQIQNFSQNTAFDPLQELNQGLEN